MSELINSYYDWLKKNTLLDEKGSFTEITTPFLDRHNDCIQFYSKINSNGEVFLTDDGYVISDLISSGFSFKTPKRKNMLKNILLNYHIELDKNSCLTTSCSIKDFPHKQHFYIQGILAINDLFIANKSNVSSFFLEDISLFLEDNEILFNPNIKLSGQSGFDHNINYILPARKKRNIPEQYINVINKPDKTSTESNIFAWNDLKNTRNTNHEMFVILNDTDKSVKSDIITAYKEYKISPLLWSDKKGILTSLNHAV